MLLAISVTLLYTFMKNKKERSYETTKVSDGIALYADVDGDDDAFMRERKNRYESDEESSDYAKKYRRPNARAASRDFKDSASGSDLRQFCGGESDVASGLNVALLDCSEGTMSADGYSSNR